MKLLRAHPGRAVFLLGPLILLLLASAVSAQSGGEYTLTRWTVAGGGASRLTAGAYTLCGSAGQADAGMLTGGEYRLTGGFWNIRAQPHLALSKSVTPTTDVAYHGVVTYTLVLSNTGAARDPAVILTDTLPANVDFGAWIEQPAAGLIQTGNAITWTGVLTEHTALTFIFTATHTGDYDDVITNTAYFSGTYQQGYAEATFSVIPGYALTVQPTGNGAGTVSSDPAGIACGATCVYTYSAGTVVTLTAETPISSTFTGWDGAGCSGQDNCIVTMNTAQIVTATFALNQYTITFDSAGGTAIDPITQDYGTPITAPDDPTRTGYTFAGWEPELPATMPAENLTVTAQWTANEYTVTFAANGGSAPVPLTKTVTYGDVYGVLATTNREGYTFVGWFTAASGGSEVTEATLVTTAADHTLHAQWTIVAFQAGVLFTPDHAAQAQPGDVLTFTHTLTNTGEVTDTFDLTFTGVWGELLTTTPITLTVGATATVQVRITVPTGIISGTVNSTVITATSRLAPTVYASVRDTITVYTEPVEPPRSYIFLPLVLRQ